MDAAIEIGLELEVMKRRRDERGGLSAHDARSFLAYQNTYRRHLLALGIKAAAQRAPDLQAYLSQKAAAAQAEAA